MIVKILNKCSYVLIFFLFCFFSYPMASLDQLAENSDNCAICWEKMESARKLPCGHLFHNSCLQSWLEQDTSCPTCRLTLSMQGNHRENTPEVQLEGQAPVRRNDNHFFHFDGSRYVSWLPSFSVEVSHSRVRGSFFTSAHNNSQMDAMARQVSLRKIKIIIFIKFNWIRILKGFFIR